MRPPLRLLLESSSILYPPSPALALPQCSPEELRDRISRARKAVEGLDVLLGWDDTLTEDLDKQGLLGLIQERTLDLLENVQRLLTKEGGESGGGKVTDHLLSMSERATIRVMLSYLITKSLMLSTTSLAGYLSSTPSPSVDHNTVTSLYTTLKKVLGLINPDERNDTPTNANSNPTLQSFITSTLLQLQNLPFILTSSILLGWCQSFPPTSFSDIRKSTIELLEGIGLGVENGNGDGNANAIGGGAGAGGTGGRVILGPAECLSVLGGVLVIITPPPKPKQKVNPTLKATKPQPKIELLDDEGSILDKEKERDVSRKDWPEYVGRTVKVLMGKQLLRKGGVRGLMSNVFGNSLGKTDVVDPKILDHLSKVLSLPPLGIPKETFCTNLTTQLIQMISPPMDSSSSSSSTTTIPTVSEQFIHASCHVLSELIVKEGLVKEMVIPMIHGAFLPSSDSEMELKQSSQKHDEPTLLTSAKNLTKSLSILLPILSHSPPSLSLLQILITPILPQLFALLYTLSKDPTADPLTREEVKGVMRMWGRVVDLEEGLKGLVGVLESGRGWGKYKGKGEDEGKEIWFGRDVGEDLEGEDSGLGVFWGRYTSGNTMEQLKVKKKDRGSAKDVNISLTNADLKATEVTPPGPSVDDEQEDREHLAALDQLDLQPSPRFLVEVIKSFDRKELTGSFFVKVLGLYQASSELAPESLSSVLYLQVVLQMMQQLSASALSQPEHILVFIEHALRPAMANVGTAAFVDAENKEELVDSDDEDGGELEDEVLEKKEIVPDEEDISKMGMFETAMALFMAVLDGNDGISSSSNPILGPIKAHLERLSKHRLSEVKQVARQCLLFLSARSAGSSANKQSATAVTPTIERYQEALKLLQDPLLPVRGHGLIILQDVVKAKDFDRALVPAIMDVFMRTIQDDDSFMYLNAVKGLSSMVDGLGKEVFQTLVRAYTSDLTKVELVGEELDRRLRIGEALQRSVGRSGAAFGVYANSVVPHLMRIFPNSSLPTVIRSSSLSILATGAEADSNALLPWTTDLLSSCIDLIQIESSTAQSQVKVERVEGKTALPEPIKVNDSKHPALRRAALVFVGLLLDAVAQKQEDQLRTSSQRQLNQSLDMKVSLPSNTAFSSNQEEQQLDGRMLQRGRTVIGYVAQTDVDSLVRHQAREVSKILQSLQEGRFGL